jgi:hypothetical protein
MGLDFCERKATGLFFAEPFDQAAARHDKGDFETEFKKFFASLHKILQIIRKDPTECKTGQTLSPPLIKIKIISMFF